MPKAVWNGQVIAESDQTVIVEGNHYFPPDSINAEFFNPIKKTSVCHWKGVASYYDVTVEGKKSKAAAWTYADPSADAAQIKDHIAFYRHKVQIEH